MDRIIMNEDVLSLVGENYLARSNKEEGELVGLCHEKKRTAAIVRDLSKM